MKNLRYLHFSTKAIQLKLASTKLAHCDMVLFLGDSIRATIHDVRWIEETEDQLITIKYGKGDTISFYAKEIKDFDVKYYKINEGY